MARRAVFAALFAALLIAVHAGAPRRFEANAAEETVKAFMAARLARDERLARTFLTNELHRAFTASGFDLTGAPNPHYHTFRITGLRREDDGSWTAHVEIREEFAGRGIIGRFEERITMKPVGGGYRVAAIERGPYHALP